MNRSCFKSRFTAGSLDGAMKDAGHLDRHDQVLDAVCFLRGRDKLRHRRESAECVLDDGRLHKDAAVKVAEHPLGSTFGAID